MKREEEYAGWIKVLADYQGGRTYFADQTVESMMLLEKLVEIYKPTVIIELGTAHGLSTRLWIRHAPRETKIICVDASFDPLIGSSVVLPVEMNRLTLMQRWVHDVKLSSLWTDKDIVLLYVDIHSDHRHVLNHISNLPTGSIVVFDDLWRSSKKLDTDEEKEAFFQEVVIPQVDRTAPLAIMPRDYAPYWKNGGFWGFTEVPIICEWTAANRVKLHWEKGAKLVWFQWPHDKEQ